MVWFGVISRLYGGNEQCGRFSRNIAEVALKIIYFYYQKIYLLDQIIQKINYLILKKT